ncbi:hypothetical protein [Mycolicibacterium sp.]|uniref:hypothetical protein n=1 Tax=Mycolicibacterium sp. TaxID=2320850 RepID=UPI0037CC7A80
MTTPYQTEEIFEFTQPETNWESGQYEEILETDREAALASELLEIATEEELDEFLGKLARGVVRGASKFVKSPIGKALGGVLKNVAKSALPMVGGALGSMVLPGVGTALGSKLGSLAGNLLEEEEIAMLGEVQAQEEAARRFVRFAGASYRNLARTPRSVPPRVAVRAASLSAARSYAPGLLRAGRSGYGWRSRRRSWPPADDFDNAYGADWSEPTGDPYAAPMGATSGQWVRRGNRVTLIGL